MEDELDLADWHPRSPTRRPDWRWLRAYWLAETRRRTSRRWDDDWVRRARRYLLRARRDFGQQRLLIGDPALWGACLLCRPEHWLLRAELEARVLAGEDPDWIAARLALTPDALGAYLKLFFDVAERFGATDYIRAFAIGPEAFDGSGRASLGQVWKLLAYQGGPLVADALADAFVGLERPIEAGAVEAFLARGTGRSLALLTLVAMRRVPFDDRTAHAIRALYSRFEAERLASTDDDGGSYRAQKVLADGFASLAREFALEPAGTRDADDDGNRVESAAEVA